jgi:CHAT domain-containing protein
MPETSTILFLAASPDGTQKLALDREAREIRSKIRAADHRDSLVFHTEWAVRPDDLLQYLNELRPQAVHFSGHGTTGELILNDEDGRAKPVSRDALRALFGLHAKTVRLVVLNACFSKAQADAIVEVIDCAVGMSQAIGDEAAIVFAAAFYRKLGFGDSVQAAFDEGCVALMLQGIPEEKTPVLLVRRGVDASQVFLVGPSANPS